MRACLSLYDPGGFFLPHRDSEKAPGMFGTLLIQLPAPHSGGELRIRDGGREVCIDLSATDSAELGFAAFYADCEHEVRPVEAGHRLCLVFNCAFLLERSEFPLPAPKDCSQAVALSCRCEDCRALQTFALEPRLHEQRFRVRQDRREHLQRQIAQHGLDMGHITERTGSPQTLVCRKTRANYGRQCRQHAEDVAAMCALHALGGGALEAKRARLDAAAARQPYAAED